MPPVLGLLYDWRAPLAAIALLAGAPATGQELTFHPAQVEAELVQRFTEFIDWPQDRLNDPKSPFILGLVGRNGVGPALEKLARDRTIKNHPVEIRRLDGPEGAEACHAVWITSAADSQLAAVLARTSGKPILTLGDTEGFAERGVMINLRRGPTHIAFEINLDEARKSGLKFSSRLLALGKIIASQVSP
jgi:hypothetical protein